MTLKQLFKRYLKEKGLYGALVEYIKQYYCIDYNRCLKHIENSSVGDLFWFTGKMTNCYHIKWYYYNKTLYDFVKDWCVFEKEIKRGDVLTVKTIEGKYEFKYIALDLWLTRMEVETDTHCFIKLERISKVNGKECNYAKGWAFKKDINNIRKI